MQAVEPDDAARDRTEIFILAGLFLLILGILLVYSQTLSFTWDEGFHLLAAQLILHGKRHYLDFFLRPDASVCLLECVLDASSSAIPGAPPTRFLLP